MPGLLSTLNILVGGKISIQFSELQYNNYAAICEHYAGITPDAPDIVIYSKLC